MSDILEIVRGDSAAIIIAWTDDSGDPVDLSDVTDVEVFEQSSNAPVLTAAVVGDGTAGETELTVTWPGTTDEILALDQQSSFRIIWTFNDGETMACPKVRLWLI